MASAKELSELTVDDLRRRATELRETLFQDQLKLRTGTLDNPMERTKHRRDLARVLTVLTQKTAPQAPAPQAAAASPAPPEVVGGSSAKKPKARTRAGKS